MSASRNVVFPVNSLPSVVLKIRKIDHEIQDHLAEKLVIANAMGYKRFHGTWYEMIDALIQYDLIVEVEGQYKLSANALKILRNQKGAPERAKAIMEAAFAPSLFKELHNLYGNNPPDDDKLKAILIGKGFSQNQVDAAIGAFRGTVEFVNEETKGFDIESLEELRSEVQMKSQTSKLNSAGNSSITLPPSSLLNEKKETEWRLIVAGGSEIQIKYSGPVTSEGLQNLIEFIEFERKVFVRLEGAE